MPIILKQKQAKAAGLPRFFTGKACLRGHMVERYTAGGRCCECQRASGAECSARTASKYSCTVCGKPATSKKGGLCQAHHMAAWRRSRGIPVRVVLTPEQRAERTRESARRSRLKHRERINRYIAAYQKAHPEQGREKSARWRAANLERAREVGRTFMNAHPEINAKRRALKLCAMPAWADEKKIAEMYEARRFAREFFEQPIHVDHIVPLDSTLVCGLHCEANLQLLPGVENSRKRNRYWPDMPE